MTDLSIINAFNNIKLPLLIIGQDGGLLHSNFAADCLFGYGRGELMGQPVFNILPVTSVLELNALIPESASSVIIEDITGSQLCGSSLRLAGQLTAWTDAEQGLQHAMVLRDVSEEKRVHHAMNVELVRNNNAITSAGIGVFEYGLPANTAKGPDIWRALMDLDETDSFDMRESWFPRCHPSDVQAAEAALKGCIDNIDQTSCAYEYRLRSKDGSSWNWRRSDLTVIKRDEFGKATRFAGAATDISKQKETKRILHHGTEKFRSIFENSPIGKAIVNDDNVIVQANRALCSFLGYSADTIFGTELSKYTYPEDRHITVPQLNGVLPGKIPNNQVEKRFVHADGTLVYGLLSTGRIGHSDEESKEYIYQIIDVTERHKTEESRKKFVAVVSHELRTPLTSVLGALSLLSSYYKDAFSSQAERLLFIAQVNGKRLHTLVNDILDFEKASSQQMKFDLSRHQIVGLVEDSVLANVVFAEHFGVSFNVKCADRSLTAIVDPKRLEQVITNLLTNAAKFAFKGSMIEVMVEAATDMVCVSITNDGDGIPEGFRDTIFEPFAQSADAMTRIREGTGLGLNISKQIIEQTGGTIGYNSTENGKTTFWFTLPAEVHD
jgi:PAS domain S-box-containing protein